MRWLVALTVAALLAVLATLIRQVDRPYPGFFFSADFRVFPVSPPVARGRSGLWRPIVAWTAARPSRSWRVVATPPGPCTTTSSGRAGAFAVDLPPAAFACPC